MAAKIKSKKITSSIPEDHRVEMDMETIVNQKRGSKLADPGNRRILENVLEFSRAGKSVKLFRLAFREELRGIKDKLQTPRLQKLMLEVVKSDPCNERGMRTASLGDLKILNGFEFNKNAQQGIASLTDSVCTIDRAEGKISLNIPAFEPAFTFNHPVGATHYNWIFAAAEIDFEKGTARTFNTDSDIKDLNKPSSAITLARDITPNLLGVIFILCGIRYFEITNGFTSPVGNGSYNTPTIIKTDFLNEFSTQKAVSNIS